MSGLYSFGWFFDLTSRIGFDRLDHNPSGRNHKGEVNVAI